MTTIIFDFNRTIYDPDTDVLTKGVLPVLRELKNNGHHLYLVSRFETGREAKLKNLNIADIFEQAVFIKEKTPEVFNNILRHAKTKNLNTYVVGDHLYEEIRIGNELGLLTIHFKQGKFAGLPPRTKHDYPWRTIHRMDEIIKLVEGTS